MKKQGFTLVEIMIVVMIIGLLAAIALPSFQRARRNAQRNACVENLRQINSAVQQYLIEEREDAFAGSSADLLVYFQTGNFPECPSNGAYTIGDGANNPTCSLSGSLNHFVGSTKSP